MNLRLPFKRKRTKPPPGWEPGLPPVPQLPLDRAYLHRWVHFWLGDEAYRFLRNTPSAGAEALDAAVDKAQLIDWLHAGIRKADHATEQVSVESFMAAYQSGKRHAFRRVVEYLELGPEHLRQDPTV